MKSVTIKSILFFVLLLLFSCKEANDSKLNAYLESMHIPQKESSISVIDPTYCGSCTQFTIHWMNTHRSKKEYKSYYILTTDSIPADLFKSLNSKSFHILIINPEKLKRLGYGGAVSYNFTFNKAGELKERVIKRR